MLLVIKDDSANKTLVNAHFNWYFKNTSLLCSPIPSPKTSGSRSTSCLIVRIPNPKTIQQNFLCHFPGITNLFSQELKYF